MSQWRITAWSREPGEGRIASPHFGELTFGASVAGDQDFALGERVEATLDASKTAVASVTPVSPHFRASVPPSVHAPALLPSISRHVVDELERLPHHGVARLVTAPDAGIEWPSAWRAAGSGWRLRLSGLRYIGMPVALDIRYVRLATERERDHLNAERFELRDWQIALAFVYREAPAVAHRFAFVICEGVSVEELPRPAAPGRDPLAALVLDLEATDQPPAEDAMKAAWLHSTDESALLAVGELVTPVGEMLAAAASCVELAIAQQPSFDPDVIAGVDCLRRALAGAADNRERGAISNRLSARYTGVAVPLPAWATICALCVGLSPTATCWYHARAAAACAIKLLGADAGAARVADELRRFLRCPSVDRLVEAWRAHHFTLP